MLWSVHFKFKCYVEGLVSVAGIWIADTGEHIRCIPLPGLPVQVNTFGAFLCLDCRYR